ncbi:Xaa-Pro aminopeptidase [Avibacterium sp. 21-594]|uniref:Xaa-Pro aminopeptidase n=1 Tax=Avibacterium sp. 21-594 TaxID=2911535 RepID=UPI002245AC31|nr:Xaa-Pro aminopeptidase [Avibacterium sp. 21-594]MCW9714684.1 Xaa-Pro aminopeptidase [Avibacterium sp. 21-594]
MNLAYLAEIPAEEFAQRREKMLAQMAENSVAVIFSAKEQVRNRDCNYPFRQDSYFWYLTGFNEPDAVLLLTKTAQQSRTILFLRPSDPLMETWNGRRLGVEKAAQQLNLDQAYSIEDFATQWQSLSQDFTTLYHNPAPQSWGNALLEKSAVQFSQIFDWADILDEMRLFKSANELALLQQAGQISALGHLRAMKQTRPNRLEFELEGELLHEFHRFGARFPSFNYIIAGGDNACILHYGENDQALKDGELVLVDSGCEFAHYAGDITRTYPVNGKFSQAQREIYEIVLHAQKHAINALVAGNTIQQVSEEVIRIKVEGLVRLGILQGEVDQLIADEAYKAFYMHGLGHWLGIDVHDVGRYSLEKDSKLRDRPLEVGMVLTVEPGLYIPANADVPEQYKGIGVRIEDDIVITEYGNKVLTSAVPKEIDEIEQVMAHNA